MIASALFLAVTIASPPAENPDAVHVPQGPMISLAAAAAALPVPDAPVEPWMMDRPAGRPAALKAMYGTFVALQAVDLYSTSRAIDAGAREANPVVAPASGNQAAMLAIKAVTSATTVYFAERVRKRNPKASVVLMAIVNGVTAAAVAHNLRNAR